MRHTRKPQPRLIAYAILCVICCQVGCTDNSEKIEYYRRTIGQTSTTILFATFHANELALSKISAGIASQRDQERIADLLASLERHKKRMEEMLDQTYTNQSDRERDQDLLPIIQELLLATDALNRYLESENGNPDDLDKYCLHRIEFFKKFRALFEKHGCRPPSWLAQITSDTQSN